MPHEAIASDLSIIGVKQEAVQGTEQAGNYRQALCANFKSKQVPGRTPYVLAAGFKGAFGQGLPSTHQEVSFTIYAGSSDANQMTLLDIVYMFMDFDAVTGGSPYTHTFKQQTANIAKKSWSIYHDDGRTNYSINTGFVADKLKITIDKDADPAVITCEVSGFAWQEADDATKTVNLAANYNIWSPGTAKLMRGATQVDNFNPIVIDLDCATRVHKGINDTMYPSNIDGVALNLLVTLTGEWNEAADQVSDALLAAWRAGTVQTDDLIISFGPTAANDYFTLTLPRWAIQSADNKDVEPDSMLPQNLEAYPVWQGDIANNGWKIEMTNTLSGNAGSL